MEISDLRKQRFQRYVKLKNWSSKVKSPKSFSLLQPDIHEVGYIFTLGISGYISFRCCNKQDPKRQQKLSLLGVRKPCQKEAAGLEIRKPKLLQLPQILELRGLLALHFHFHVYYVKRLDQMILKTPTHLAAL